jgi:hypothetical protein
MIQELRDMQRLKLRLDSEIVKTLWSLIIIIILCHLFSSNVAAQNGINISEAKVYDDRTLMIMLEQLNEQLRNINFIDQKRLAAQLGMSQGFQSRDVSRSFDIGTLPIPGLKTTSKPDSEGDLSVSEQVEDRGAFTPKRPDLPELQVAPKYEPMFAENPSDLLDDQVNLTYQIFNLRMILERSLTDRLWTDNDTVAHLGPRLIAVVGFDIDVQPPKDARDSAAYVEITITPTDPNASAPSLIALMPQDKTYNSAALNSKSNAFGGSAVLKIITIGYSERRRGQTFYLFRDSDTSSLAYPRQSGEKMTKFGWVFRPVLGRRAVTSEKRHMFAVIALPTYDTNQPEAFPVKIDAHTYWRKYNRDTLTTSGDDKLVADYPLSDKRLIPSTAQIQTSLQPIVNAVRWYATDDKTAVVTVEGGNFFTGTSVYLGSTVSDNETNGLLIKSSQSLQFRTTLAALTTGDAVLNGRYGTTAPLYINDAVTMNVPEGVKINEFSLRPETGRKLVNLRLKLQNRDSTSGKDLTISLLPSHQSLIIAVQNTPLAQPYDLQDSTCTIPLSNGTTVQKQCVLVQAYVPAELLKGDAIVSIKYPFRGSLWADSWPYYEPYQVDEVTRLGSDGTNTMIAIPGRGFDSGWKVQLDKTYSVGNASASLTVIGDTLLTFKVEDKVLPNYKNLLVIPSVGAPIVKAIPPATPPTPEPKLDEGQNAIVQQNTAPSVEFKGSDLTAITKVTFEDKELPRKIGKGGKSITVFLSRRVTARLGTVQVLLWAGNTIIPASVTVQEKAATTK